MNLVAVSIWWCGVRRELLEKTKCAYHAPEMGCGLRTIKIEVEILDLVTTEMEMV